MMLFSDAKKMVEDIVKGMKKKASYFKKKYGKDAKLSVLPN